MTTVTMDLPLWSKFSSMTKLARVLAYCLRFVHHKHRIRDPLLTHPPALSSEELKKAHLKIVQHLQRKAWPDEFQQLSSKQSVLLSSPTAKLNPYLDSSGVIRLGGRLSKSKTLPAEVQHPILLPKTPLVKSFLLDFHHKHHHPGPSAMEALLYQSYYPVGCRQMVKSVCKHCVVCRKALAKTIIQLWKRWHTAYVQSLQSRQKWTRPQPNISVGDIVLLKDDSLKLHSWPLAKVTDVSPGPDGVVRVVTLTLPGGRTFTRHVRHLVPLMRASDCSLCPGEENVQDPRDGFGDYHSSSPERSQQRSQQP